MSQTEATGSKRITLWLTVGAILAALATGGVAWWISRDTDKPPDPRPGGNGDAPVRQGPPWFRDVTEGSGLQFTCRNGEEADQYTLLETLGSGVALIDYNGDGLLDVFIAGGGGFDGPNKTNIKGYPCKLFKNLGKFQFKDVSAEVGLDTIAWWYTHGAAVADFDRDGWPDLLVTGYGRMALFHNESNGKGGRRFVDVTGTLGLQNDSWSTSAGWADLDGDGWPDLYVCHYANWSFANNPFCPGEALGIKRETCGPERFKPQVHALFRNEKRPGGADDKDRKFRNVSAEHGFKPEGFGLGVVLADLNGDGKPDIYVANDTNANFLFLNRNGKLEEKARLAGVATDEAGNPEGSMGVDAADIDGSGRPSLWVTNFQEQNHALYLNLGKERFHHHARAAGTAAIGKKWVGFGTGFFDLDNDGWEDLVIANGHVWRRPIAGTPKQRAVLLRSTLEQGKRVFRDVSVQGGEFFQTLLVGRGVAVGDLDNDGWPDLVVTHTNGPVVLLRNQVADGAKQVHRWLGIKLIGRDHRDVVGSTIIVEGSEQRLTRFAKGGGSYLSACDQRFLFGLGESNKALGVKVQWSWGETQQWGGLEPNAYWVLREGKAGAERLR